MALRGQRIGAELRRLDAEAVDGALACGWERLPCGTRPAGAPDDLATFLRHCGGLRCPSGLEIAARVVPAQEAILGERHPDDASAHWWVVAEGGRAATAERVVIDFRDGRCFDAFWDVFGVAGSMPVVARSFADLLDRLRVSDGQAYWPGELGLGDAYD